MGDIRKPLRIVMGWQLVLTMLLAVVSAWLAGVHGAISAFLGGLVAMAGGVAFAWFASSPKTSSHAAAVAWDGLTRIFKAEAAKVGVIVVLLWLVLATYKQVMVFGFIGSFILSVIVFSMAVFLRNPVALENGKCNVD